MERRIAWKSNITEIRNGELFTHNIDQRKIIREFSYEEMIFFLLKGRKPNKKEKNILRAIIISHISHGITGQSTLAVMEAADCRSSFLHALIAGFSVGSGIYHQGGLQATMEGLKELAEIPNKFLKDEILRRINQGERIMGYGHRYHERDPRAETLLQIAKDESFEGKYLKVAKKIESILENEKSLHMNIEAACGGLLLDLKFPIEVAHLFIIVGRSPMFSAVYLERLAQGRKPFQRIEISDILMEDE